MDGSKRSKHSNAYFTGMGPLKRIVLFDTLVAQMSEEEILAVLAHEIGHEKKRHVMKMTAVSAVIGFLMFWVLDLCLGWTELYAAFGFAAPSRHALLLVVSLISGPATFFLTPCLAALSRRHEYEADAFAAKATSGADLGRGAGEAQRGERLEPLGRTVCTPRGTIRTRSCGRGWRR